MKIWRVIADINNFERLIESSQSNKVSLRDFIGKSLLDSWVKPNLVVINEKGRLKRGDCPYFGILVFSIFAIEILNDLMKDCVELLGIDCDSGNYKIINLINVVDCLDYSKSVIQRYDDGERISNIKKYAFIPEKIFNQNIFVIPERPRSPVFVSNEFKNRVLESGLKGFKFEEIWDSNE